LHEVGVPFGGDGARDLHEPQANAVARSPQGYGCAREVCSVTLMSAFDDWLARGLAHLREGRPVDAMWCLRRAVRLQPASADAHYLLGDALWRLGRGGEARTAWNEAIAASPRHEPAHSALSEACLSAGDAAGARAAADRALAAFPGNARFALVHAIASLLLADRADDAPEAEAGRAIAQDPRLVAAPSLAMPLAVALDRAPPSAARSALLGELAGLPQILSHAPPMLLALVLENVEASPVLAELVALGSERVYAPAEHDALRRVAVATRRHDPTAGRELATRYATLCAAVFAPPAPLTWPRRTAGARLRVLVLEPAQLPAALAADIALLATLPHDTFDVTRVDMDDDVDVPGGGDAVEVSLARTLAAGDPDVLIDLVGMTAATGPLLAQRPARAVWTMASLPVRNESPIVDRVLDGGTALASALDDARATTAVAAACELDAGTLSARWTDALRVHQGGDAAGAVARYSALLEQEPGHAPAHYLRGVAKLAGDDVQGARADFAAALAAAPGYIDARMAAAREATAAGDAAAAVRLVQEGVARDGGHAGLWRLSGLAHLRLRDAPAAVAAFERALALDPTDAATHFNHGVALQMQGVPQEAGRAYQRALVFNPRFPDAEFNVGILLSQMGQADAAISAFENVLQAEPRNAAAYKNLAEVLYAAGRTDAWLALCRRFEANCPDALSMAVVALQAHQLTGNFTALERCLDRLRREEYQPQDESDLVACLEELLYLLLFFDVEPEMIGKFAQTYDTAARQVYGEPMARPAARRPGRLRVGYVSADLRNHVMGKMVWPALAHHDKSRCELFFYSLSAVEDDWTARYRELADHYEVLALGDDAAAAARIAADDIDVLVDLCTHTKGARPGILARKPARVLITHIASAGTVGLSTIDFKLTDHDADLPESQAYQQESLLLMNGCVYPYRHIPPAQTHPFRREALGIAADTVVIGAFVTAMKLSRRCVALWREVLAKIPRAKLAFSPLDPALRPLYLRALAAAGIPADRVLFLPQGRDDAENQARYEVVDFVLDPMPYGGANGTLEALDMGVPVVTVLGKRHGERSSYSILRNLGVTATIAHSGREYVDLAVRLAADPGFMADVRAQIRSKLPQSVLADMAMHARNLEAAYLVALEAKAPAARASVAAADV
jgi:protein O-GlcNAc transferase